MLILVVFLHIKTVMLLQAVGIIVSLPWWRKHGTEIPIPMKKRPCGKNLKAELPQSVMDCIFRLFFYYAHLKTPYAMPVP